MGWLIATLVVLAIIYFMVVSPGFRIFAIILLGGIAIWFYSLNESSKKENARAQVEQAEKDRARERFDALAEKAIRVSELEIKELKFGKFYGARYSLDGVVYNKSDTTLLEIAIAVTLSDCANAAACVVVGEAMDTSNLNVPPGQARAFSMTFTMQGVPEKPGLSYVTKLMRAKGTPKPGATL